MFQSVSAWAGFSGEQMEQVTQAVSNAASEAQGAAIEVHSEAHGSLVHIIEGWEALGVWGIPFLTVLMLLLIFQFRRPISRALAAVLGKVAAGT